MEEGQKEKEEEEQKRQGEEEREVEAREVGGARKGRNCLLLSGT